MAYWTQSDLEDKIGAEVVRQVFDDDNDGSADAGAIARLQVDSDSYVEGFLRTVYNLDTVRASPPNQVVRLSLDYAIAQMAKRRPDLVRDDWQALEMSNRAELKDLRMGVTRLDVVGDPEPAANEGGRVIGRSLTCPPRKVFLGGMGDF